MISLPATPEVRATVFRVIADYPGVENLGTVPGGLGLSLPNGERLVVDPANGRENGTSVFVTMDAAVAKVANPVGGVSEVAELHSLVLLSQSA